MDFLRKNPVRIFAVAVAILALLGAYGVKLPVEEIQGLISALLFLVSGEIVQRVEDKKTASKE